MSLKQDDKYIYNTQVGRIKDLNKRLTMIFENTRDKVVADLVKYRESITKGGIVLKSKEDRLVNLIQSINKEIALLTNKSYDAVKKDFFKTLESTYYLEAWAIEKAVNTELLQDYLLNIPKLNKKFIEAAFDKRVGGFLLKDRFNRLKNGVQYLLQNAIAQNITEGQSVKSLSKNLKLIDNALNTGLKNTQTIARTELLKAYSIGNEKTIEEAVESGVEFTYVWSSSLDDKTRPDHAAVDNKEATINENGIPVWVVGGVTMKGPRLPLIETGSRAEAKQVINCRCRKISAPYGIKPTKRTAKTKEGKWVTVNGDLTAQEWIKKEYGITIDTKTKIKIGKESGYVMDVTKIRNIKMPQEIKKAGIDSKKYKDWVLKNWSQK